MEAAGLVEQEEEQEERLPYWVEATHNLTKEVAGGDPTVRVRSREVVGENKGWWGGTTLFSLNWPLGRFSL